MPSVLWGAASRFPDRCAVLEHESSRQLSYRELLDRVARLATGFVSRQLLPGDRVALLMRNSIEYVETYFAAIAAGGVVVPLNIRLTNRDFDHMLRDSGATFLVVDAEFADRLAVDVDLSQIHVYVARADGRSRDLPLLDELRSDMPPLVAPHEAGPEDLCSLMYTSGTTGLPKAVMLSHRSWTTVGDTSVGLLGFRDGERVLHVAPLTHGAGFLVLPAMAEGGVNMLCESYDPGATARLIADGQVNSLFLVPSMIRMLLDSVPSDWAPAPEFGTLYYAGSPIQPETFRDATAAFDGRLVQSFGQMEAPLYLTALTEEDHRTAVNAGGERLMRSAGRVLPGVQLHTMSPEGDELGPNEVGEVVVKAPQAMLGYWNRPDATSDALRNGWLHTGDGGYLDDDGVLFIVDRLKDMIVTGGSNVYASEVEAVLDRLPGIRESAVIGLPDRLWGEAVTAVVVSAEAERPSVDDLRAGAKESLADYKVPKQFIWVDALPRNAYGKVLKRQLQAEYGASRDPGHERR